MQEDSDISWGNDPLYEGTTWTSKDVLIVLELFKVLGHMGDGLENIILGLIASIMPANNSIAKQIDKTSKSNYFFQETIKSGHSMFSKLRIYEILNQILSRPKGIQSNNLFEIKSQILLEIADMI